MSSPRWQAENGAEPWAGVGAVASQVLVSEQAHPDEGMMIQIFNIIINGCLMLC